MKTLTLRVCLENFGDDEQEVAKFVEWFKDEIDSGNVDGKKIVTLVSYEVQSRIIVPEQSR